MTARPDSFDPLTPAGGSLARNGDDEIRKVKQYTQNAYNDLHSSTGAGVTHRPTYHTNVNVSGNLATSQTDGSSDIGTSSNRFGDAFLTTLNVSSTATLSGDLAVDTNTLFVDVSEDRVGIGTSSPATDLEVVNSANSVIRVRSTSAGAESAIHFVNADSGSNYASDGLWIGITASEQAVIDQQENNDLGFATNATRRMTIKNSGRVGVGTASPTELFDVNGTSKATTLNATTSVILGAVTHTLIDKKLVEATSQGTPVAGDFANGVTLIYQYES